MLHEVNKSCTTQHAVAQGGYVSEVIHKNTARHRGEKDLHFFLLNWPLHARCVSPGDPDLVATDSELSLGCSDCRVEQK